MSRRWVYCFQERFADLVADGTKRQTIRGVRKDGRSPALGDTLSLRTWLGRPRASGQRLLRPECPCVGVGSVWINEGGVSVDGYIMDLGERNELAKSDGFRDYEEMHEWFREQHRLPFRGVLIRW